jgi:hypothetical protein
VICEADRREGDDSQDVLFVFIGPRLATRWLTMYQDVLEVDCLLKNFVDDRLYRKGGETDFLIEGVVSLWRVDAMLLNHQRRRIWN